MKAWPTSNPPWRWLAILAAVLMPLAAAAVVEAADAATQAEYLRRFHDLAPKDIDGHLDLAEWCRDQQAYDLLKRQCKHVLSFAPKHRQALLYLQLAEAQLASGGGTSGGTDTGGTVTPAAPGSSGASAGAGGASPGGARATPAGRGKFRLLSDEEIQRLKQAELLAQERIVVKFHDDVRDRFWNYMSAREGLGRADRVRYNRMNPSRLAQAILQKVEDYKRSSTEENPFFDEFSPLIEITSDPAVFREYERNIWPTILDGCASAKCHGGDNAVAFRLLNERTMSDKAHYTNFFVLSEWGDGDRKLIDRDRPAESLLLQFGYENPVAGTTVHPVDIEPVYRSAGDRRFQQMGTWISALKVPKPDYGLTLDDLSK